MMGTYGIWGWLALGLGLIALEVLLLNLGFLLWLGIAALAMGGVTWLFEMSWMVELLVFAALSMLAGLVAWKLHHGADRATDAADGLHDRGAGLVGREFALDEAITAGIGRIRVDDSVWRVSGPDLPAGTRVRVTGVDGATLRVSGV